MDSEVVIIGGGITGLAAGIGLQDKAVVLERDERPGGIVKSFCFDGGYWFDNVVHLLHVRDSRMREWFMNLMGDTLKSCPPVGFVQTKEGRTHYPIQNNINELNEETADACWAGLEDAHINARSSSYREFLLNTFGQALCDIFFFPYNEKCWKYPLNEMTSNGQSWNINKPGSSQRTYNAEGYYPRPDKNARLRGMEILPRAMARRVKNLKLNCEVLSIEPRNHEVWTTEGMYRYGSECVSTIPLPQLVQLCNVPMSLKREVYNLRWNKVISIALSIYGPRPKNTGHWCYYADPDIPFTKVIYMTEFDEHNAPANGFGLLIEVPEPYNKHSLSLEVLCGKVINSLEDLGIFRGGNHLINCHTWEVNPAYVVFTKDTQSIIDNCVEYFDKFGIKLLGRYGSWEYSSMAENIESGLDYALKFNRR